MFAVQGAYLASPPLYMSPQGGNPRMSLQVTLCRVLQKGVEELDAYQASPHLSAEERRFAEEALMGCHDALQAAREGRLEDAARVVGKIHERAQQRQERAAVTARQAVATAREGGKGIKGVQDYLNMAEQNDHGTRPNRSRKT